MQATAAPGRNLYFDGQHGAEEPEDTEQRLALIRERDELRKDAERYRAIKRWHRAYCVGGEPGGMNVHILTTARLGALDSAIDAAMAKTLN